MRLAPDGRGSPGGQVVRLPGGETIPIVGMEGILGDLFILGRDVVLVVPGGADLATAGLDVIDLTARSFQRFP